MTELEEALSLTTRTRRATFERFFDGHPGGSGPAPGYGRALIDFLDWEIDSGRVVDRGGSRWWRAVNGFLVLDLRRATLWPEEPLAPAHPAVEAWMRFAGAPSGQEQRALWEAHDQSITRGAIGAVELLEGETPAEQSFIRLVLRILRRSTTNSEPTETPVLGEVVRRKYPQRYPIRQQELDELFVTISK